MGVRLLTNLADKFEKLTKPCQAQLDWLTQKIVIRRQIGLSGVVVVEILTEPVSGMSLLRQAISAYSAAS